MRLIRLISSVAFFKCDYRYCALSISAMIVLMTTVTAVHAKSLEKNVIYGMVSGSALLMDIYHPDAATRKGLGVIFVPGSGWSAEDHYDAVRLNAMNESFGPANELNRSMVNTLQDNGFTVFVANHRAAPVFKYPAAVNDIAQAVKFVRSRARQYEISERAIGGAGTSSGGNLLSLMGVDQSTPEISRLQAIVTVGSPMDFPSLYKDNHHIAGLLASYMGFGISFLPPQSKRVQAYRAASTLSYVSEGDAPHFFIHGSEDFLVPKEQSLTTANKLRDNSVETKVRIVKGGRHTRDLVGKETTWLNEMVLWFEDHLDAQDQ